MSLLKEPEAIAVDETSKATQEFVESLSVCLGVMQAEEETFGAIEQLRDRLAEALRQFRHEVRRLGFLPADGNIERAEVEALLMKAKGLLGMESEAAAMREGLKEQAALALERIDENLAGAQGEDPGVRQAATLRQHILEVRETLSELSN